MKKKIIFMSVLVICITLFEACQQEQSIPKTINAAYSIPEDCKALDTLRTGVVIHRIKEACAVEYIDKYKRYIDTVKTVLTDSFPGQFPDVSQKLIRGARIDLLALKEIVAHAEAYNQTHQDTMEIFAMIGITEQEFSKVIFTLESPSESSRTGRDFKYFNFTYPCPTACPGN